MKFGSPKQLATQIHPDAICYSREKGMLAERYLSQTSSMASRTRSQYHYSFVVDYGCLGKIPDLTAVVG